MRLICSRPSLSTWGARGNGANGVSSTVQPDVKLSCPGPRSYRVFADLPQSPGPLSVCLPIISFISAMSLLTHPSTSPNRGRRQRECSLIPDYDLVVDRRED